VEVARGRVLGPVERGYRALVIPLEQHQSTVAGILEGVLGLDSDSPEVLAARVHDKYKPYTIRVEEVGGKPVIGFRGHPYRLSFSDFEGLTEDSERVAVATAVARLHHFINVRDVETFFETVALAKAYLGRKGAGVALSELKRKVLRGVALIHIADQVAGFIEGLLCEWAGGGDREPELLDTDSLARVEPHIPVSIAVSRENRDVGLHPRQAVCVQQLWLLVAAPRPLAQQAFDEARGLVCNVDERDTPQHLSLQL